MQSIARTASAESSLLKLHAKIMFLRLCLLSWDSPWISPSFRYASNAYGVSDCSAVDAESTHPARTTNSNARFTMTRLRSESPIIASQLTSCQLRIRRGDPDLVDGSEAEALRQAQRCRVALV